MEISPFGSVRSVQFAVSMNVNVHDGIVTDCYDSCDAGAKVLGADLSFTYIWSDIDSQVTKLATGLCEGSYQVTVTDSNGAFVRIPFSVKNASEITAKLQVFGASCESCDDGSAFITMSGGTAPYSLLWDSSAAFQTTQVASDLLPGNYTVSVLDDSACLKVFTIKVGLFKGVKIYPNPADDFLTIFTRVDGQMLFLVYDLSGRMVRSFEYSESESIIGVSTLPEGQFIYRLLDETGTELKSGHFAIIRP